MTDFLGFAAFLILPLAGASILRSKTVREMNFAGQLAVAGAAGAAIVAAVMAILSVFRIDWSRGRLVTIIAVIAAISVYFARRFERRLKPALHPGIVFFVLLTTYGLLTARESCGDLHFFWGPKAVHFYRDGGVRTTFLADKNAERMGPGYPLMLPLLYSWSATMAKQFSWWAAVLATALFLFGSVALVHSATNDGDGALLIAATLSWTCAVAFAAGGADPPLVFFETLAIVGVTFMEDSTLLPMLGLAGAVMMKLEGAVFAVAFVLAAIVARKSLRQIAIIAAPAAMLLAIWLAFVKANGLSEFYRGAGMPIYLSALPTTLRETAKAAAYELYGLPWIAPLLLLVFGKNRRASRFPLAIAAFTFAATIFYYIHVPDPAWWIAASAPRVLLTPLMALLIAAVAAQQSDHSSFGDSS